MSGLDMMFRAMGFDPKDLLAQITEFKSALDQFVVHSAAIRAKVDHIAETTDRIEMAVHALGGTPRNLVLPDDELLAKFAHIGDDQNGG